MTWSERRPVALLREWGSPLRLATSSPGSFNQYAIYSARSPAALSGTSAARTGDLRQPVKGTIAGMLAAAVATAIFGPSLTVGISVALTALIALGSGWGSPWRASRHHRHRHARRP